jgi:cytoskeletal protein CcmA (bactofilin family)
MIDATPSLLPYLMLFAVVCSVLLVLPFVPAWREWQHPSDSAALTVSQNQTSDTSFLAQQFREHMQRQLADGRQTGYTMLDNHYANAEASTQNERLPIVSIQALRSAFDTTFLRPLYVADDLSLGGKSSLREMLCLGSLTLGPRSHVIGWAHADQAAVLGEGCVLVRRVSSAVSIDLARNCSFERLHAPTLRFGHLSLPTSISTPAHSLPTWHRLRRIPGAKRWGEGAWRIDGDCDIPAWHHFTGSLVVTGVLRVGERALIEGNVKAHKGMHIGSGARVTGAAVCEQGIHLLPDAIVGGPLVSETHVLLYTRSRVGGPQAPTTVSAPDILIDRGVTTHGTVWAREAGFVLGRA